jgi:polar amino acid transport system substrate-binding protein
MSRSTWMCVSDPAAINANRLPESCIFRPQGRQLGVLLWTNSGRATKITNLFPERITNHRISYMTFRRPTVRLIPLLLLFLSGVANADVLEDVLEKGTIRFGVAEFTPWTMKSETGELIGFEIDVANKIAKDMGLKAEFKLYVWDEVIPALQNGEIDVLTGGMSITPERALQLNFTRPLAKSGVSLATNISMTRDIGNLEELNRPEITIAVVNKTLAFGVIQSFFDKATIKIHSTGEKAGQSVVDGDAHAYFGSLTQTRFLALNNPDTIDLPVNEPLLASREAIAVRKGEQELLNFLNAWVTARQADLWIATTRDYWFETLEWSKDVAR